jgi:hypothetical protein
MEVRPDKLRKKTGREQAHSLFTCMNITVIYIVRHEMVAATHRSWLEVMDGRRESRDPARSGHLKSWGHLPGFVSIKTSVQLLR